VDVRIIMATNRNLETLVYEKKFREDLFFRINVIPIHLPPLRDRKDDIPLLTTAFIDRLRQKTGKPISGLTAAAMSRFMDYDWPGNVRELKSALEYAFVVAEEGAISPELLPRKIAEPAPDDACGEAGPSRRNGFSERRALVDALRQTVGNQTQAARILGINRVTVWNRMRKYGIDLKKIITQP
jgi:DNA-binding NtrC family response regulator